MDISETPMGSNETGTGNGLNFQLQPQPHHHQLQRNLLSSSSGSFPALKTVQTGAANLSAQPSSLPIDLLNAGVSSG